MANEKSFAVIGLGQYGLSVARALLDNNQQVIGIDRDETRVKMLEDKLASVFTTDCTSLQSLREVGVQNVDVAIITFGDNLHDAIITTALLSDMNIPQIVVRLDNMDYEPILKKIGAHEIIHPTEDAGRSLAFRLSGTNLSQYFAFDKHYSVTSVTIPVGFKTKKLIDLDWRNKFDINIVLIKKAKANTKSKALEDIIPEIPKAQESVEAKDIIYVIGKNKDIINFSTAILKS